MISPQFPLIDSDIAIVRAKITLENDPKHAASFNNLGWAYLQKGEKDKAKKAFEKAIENDSTLDLVYNNLGVLYYEENQYEKAKGAFDKTLSINLTPQARFYAHFNLGRIYRRQGDYKKAATQLETALKLNPSFAPAVKEYKIAACLRLIQSNQKDQSLYENLGALYFENNEFNNALEAYQKSLMDFRRSYNLANVYLEIGNHSKSETLFRQTLKDNPQYWQAYYGLGRALKSQGKSTEAIVSFNTAFKLSDTENSAAIENDLAYAYFESGDLEQASVMRHK
jgi:tetratricopeptide (TPR) repeat protein